MSADVAGKALNEIEKVHGELTPPVVVVEAANPRNPLHRCFEWDDTTAAKRFREEQARFLLRSIRVIVDYKGKKIEQPVYVNVRIQGEDEGPQRSFYVRTTEGMSTKAYREYILKDALTYLEAAQHRWSMFDELKEVFEAIARLRKKIK